jgi:serine/threonine protein phosphatase PrpC
MRVRSVSVSEVGHVRDHNEDTLHADDTQGLWLVADGMGGQAAGEVASRIAIDTVVSRAGQGESLDPAIKAAHQAIHASTVDNPDRNGMGTTMVAARRTGLAFELAWVGDSRIYNYDAQDGLVQLSLDHSFVQDMICRGVLTEEEALAHPQKNLIHQSLGMRGEVRVDVLDWRPVKPGTLLLCSDGVSDMLTLQQLQDVLSEAGELPDIADRLRAAVLATTAEDNASFVMISYAPSPLGAVANRLRRLWK